MSTEFLSSGSMLSIVELAQAIQQQTETIALSYIDASDETRLFHEQVRACVSALDEISLDNISQEEGRDFLDTFAAIKAYLRQTPIVEWNNGNSFHDFSRMLLTHVLLAQGFLNRASEGEDTVMFILQTAAKQRSLVIEQCTKQGCQYEAHAQERSQARIYVWDNAILTGLLIHLAEARDGLLQGASIETQTYVESVYEKVVAICKKYRLSVEHLFAADTTEFKALALVYGLHKLCEQIFTRQANIAQRYTDNFLRAA